MDYNAVNDIIIKRKYDTDRSLIELFNYKLDMWEKISHTKKINKAIDENINIISTINDFIKTKQSSSFIEFNIIDILKLKYLELLIERKSTKHIVTVLKNLYYDDKIIDNIMHDVARKFLEYKQYLDS